MKKPLPQKPHKKREGAKKSRVRIVVPQVAQRFRRPTLQEQTEEALTTVPRITNETVAEHREEVLRGARKYKYPLEHSKRSIITISLSLLGIGLIGFFVYVGLSVYRYNSSSLFTYRVSQIVPFPAAKADKRWVSYESYLFEVRRYVHYYESQQQVDFASTSGKYQLATYQPKALAQVIDNAYVKELASRHKVNVSDREVNDAIAVLRVQNQLGTKNDELASVARKFFGWSIADLRRQLKQELLAQKVAAKLDTVAYAKAQAVYSEATKGTDFATLASQNSTDSSTKTNGGQYNDTAITMASQEVPPAVVRALATMKPGQVSGVIATPNAFEVVKLLATDNGKYKAAHIQIQFKDIQTYLQPLEKQHPSKRFIHVEPPK